MARPKQIDITPLPCYISRTIEKSTLLREFFLRGRIPTGQSSAMIWTILAVAAVVATKLVTALRLKDLKAKLESIQPDIDELRYKVAESEDEFESLRLKEGASESRVTHLKGVVQHLENQVKSAPASAGVMDERGAITQEAESIER